MADHGSPISGAAPAESDRPERLSVCACGAPLIPTFHWRGKEFVCIECGRLYEFFGPQVVKTTDARWVRYEALLAEWMEHAGPKLLTPGARHEGCEKCWGNGSENHVRHATDQEKADHGAALAWLIARTRRHRLTPKMRRALRLLRDHGDSVIGPGGGVVTSASTGLDSGQPWINFRTARALETLGFAEIHDYGYDGCEITLTAAGRERDALSGGRMRTTHTAPQMTGPQEAALRVLHWLEVVGTTTRGGLIVRGVDGSLSVLSRSGLFGRFRGEP
jgi:hypothetical protein